MVYLSCDDVRRDGEEECKNGHFLVQSSTHNTNSTRSDFMLIFFSNFFHLGQRPLDDCLVDLGKLITNCQTSSVEEEGEIKLRTFHYCSKDFTNISPSAQLFCFLALSVLFWSAVVHALQEHCRDCSSMGPKSSALQWQ